MITISDEAGNVVRRISGPSGKGLHRVAWDLRLDAPDRVNLRTGGFRAPWQSEPFGPLALPGTYSVSMAVRQDGELKPLGEAQSFVVKPLDLSPEATTDRAALLEFQKKTANLQRAVQGSTSFMRELQSRINHVSAALDRTPATGEQQQAALAAMRAELTAIRTIITGDRTIASRNEPTPRSVASRVGTIIFGHWHSQSPATGLHQDAYKVAAEEFGGALERLRKLDGDLSALESQLDGLGAPWTPGRVPAWQPE